MGFQNKKIGCTIFVALLLAAIITYAYTSKPIKSPAKGDHVAIQIKPDEFRFEKFDASGELQKAITEVFPKGTPKEYVDNILIRKLGSTISEKKAPDGSYRYTYKNIQTSFMQGINSGCAGYVTKIVYDENNKVISIKMERGPC